MKLSVIERLTLLGILPEQGNLMTIKIVSKLREELSFDEAEHAALQFRPSEDGKRLQWNMPHPDKDVEIGLKATSIIYETLRKADDNEQLTEQHLSLCEKFGYPEKEE